MKLCYKCQEIIPNRVKIDGKEHNLCSRKYCLICSPFKQHNTLKLEIRDRAQPHSRIYKTLTEEEKKDWNQRCYKSQKKYRLKRKIDLVNLMGGKCLCCGYDKNYSVLCFHHKDSKDKKFELNSRNFHSYKWEEILEEVEKCELLCSNCHIEKHHLNNNK